MKTITFYKKILVAGAMFVVLSAFAAPVLPAFAQITPEDPKDSSFQLVPCDGFKKPVMVNGQVQMNGSEIVYEQGSKECDFNQLFVLANRIMKFLLYFSIPLVLGIIMYTAFKYLTANGDPGKLADAKKMLVPVALGLFWILAAYLIVYTFLDKVLDDSAGNATKGILKEYFKN
jgi:hypothetical protein